MPIPLRVPCGFALIALFTGCTGLTHVPPDVAATGMPNTELALRKSMSDVDAAMAELNGMSPPAAPARQSITTAELNRPVSFAWNGPLDAGVKTLADQIGYQVTVTGPSPGKPVAVAVKLSNVDVLAAFQALGNAAGAGATVLVDPDHHVVEVDHHV
jgi:defect in organelle trafficking protein DotD